jgi:hypothetical protein
MKVNHIAVWKLHGANKLAVDSTTLELFHLENPALVASVTSNPEHYLFHVDRATAIIFMLLNGQDPTPEQQLAAAMKNVRSNRSKQTDQGIFLVIEGHTEIEAPDFVARRDFDEFAVCMDVIDIVKVTANFSSTTEAILAAVSLSVSLNVDHGIEKIGSITYLIDPATNKPIYMFKFMGGIPRISSASPFTEDVGAAVGNRVVRVIANRTLAKPARLLNASFNQATDVLQAFIAAWSALEIFIKESFKAVYEARFKSIMENGAPAGIFQRFRGVKTVMHLAEKFLVIASILDADAASSDHDEFRKLMQIRNALYHEMETPSNLPTEAVQELLLKYMRLHMDQAD